MRGGVAALMAGLIVGPGMEPLAGQTALSIHFGENADEVTGVSTGPAVSFSATHFAGPGGLSIGLGAPVDADGGTRWGSGAAWLDHGLPFLDLGIAGTLEAFGYQDPVLEATGGAAAVSAETYRELEAGPVTFRLRAVGRGGMMTSGSGTLRRVLAAGGADATVPLGPVLVRTSAELWAAAEDAYPRVSLVALLSRGRASARARVSRWLHEALPETSWAVAAEWALTDRLALLLQGTSPSTDILFFSPPQRSWGIGLRYGPGAPPAPPLPVPVFAAPGEAIRLEVSAAGAAMDGPVRVAGSFNGWQPSPMRREGDRWVVELRLEAGIHEYAFVSPDGTWFVPVGTPGRKPDGFGGHVATIVVR